MEDLYEEIDRRREKLAEMVMERLSEGKQLCDEELVKASKELDELTFREMKLRSDSITE